MIAMNKKAFMAAAIILLFLNSALVSSLFFKQASANFVGFYMPQSPPPAPILEVIGKDAGKLTLTFSVQKAGPWITSMGSAWWGNYEPSHEWNYSVSSIVWVDGNPWSHYSEQNPITVSLEGFSNGNHTLRITATAYGDKTWPTTSVYSDAIKFQVDKPLPTQTLIPTAKLAPTPAISPSPSPSLTVEPTLEPTQTVISTPIGKPIAISYVPQLAVATVALIAVAAGVLVYFKRRKG
jgi:hypothetical protein